MDAQLAAALAKCARMGAANYHHEGKTWEAGHDAGHDYSMCPSPNCRLHAQAIDYVDQFATGLGKTARKDEPSVASTGSLGAADIDNDESECCPYCGAGFDENCWCDHWGDD